MSVSYTDFLDIYPDTINDQMQKAENIYEAARDKIYRYGGVSFQEGSSILRLDVDDYADNVKERVNDNIQYGGDMNITNSLIDAAFSELYSAFEEEPILQRLGINDLDTYVNCDDSHLSINGNELHDEEDFNAVFEEAYVDAVTEIAKICLSEMFGKDFLSEIDDLIYDVIENDVAKGFAEIEDCADEIASLLACGDLSDDYNKRTMIKTFNEDCAPFANYLFAAFDDKHKEFLQNKQTKPQIRE